jgi:hypothetical protein
MKASSAKWSAAWTSVTATRPHGTNIYVGLVSFDHDKGFLVDVLGEVKWMKEEELDRFVL